MIEKKCTAENLAVEILKKPKYKHINTDFIARIAKQELSKRNTCKEALKASTSKLHQVGSSYMSNQMKYAVWQTRLKELPHDLRSTSVKDFCRQVMNAHSSSKERMPILETFFQKTLENISPIHSILDLGCGLNTLALSWMPVVDDIEYCGIDIFQDMVDFLNAFLKHMHIKGKMQCKDVLAERKSESVQLVLALKMLPILDQIEKGNTVKWLEKIPSNNLLVSYPICSLGGKSKGMRQNYSNQFDKITKGKGWNISRFDFPTELAFLIQR